MTTPIASKRIAARAAGRLDLGEVRAGHPPHLRCACASCSASQGSAAPAARLDLAEDEHVAVEGDEVDLAEAGAVVAGDDLVAEPLEVLGGEVLAEAAEVVTGVGGHAADEAAVRRSTEHRRVCNVFARCFAAALMSRRARRKVPAQTAAEL